VVSFTAVPGSRGEVKVFTLRGEFVRTLHSGEFRTQKFRWDGTDSRGAPVGSGVYLIRATDGSVTQTQKVALVK
jgi:flagellar hook assembly protein FlgD